MAKQEKTQEQKVVEAVVTAPLLALGWAAVKAAEAVGIFPRPEGDGGSKSPAPPTKK